MKEITLYGAGGHCYAVVELIRSLNQYIPIVIIDDVPKKDEILGVPINKYSVESISTNALCVAIGDNAIRKKIASNRKKEFPIFVHDSATVYPSVVIGEGSMVLPHAVLDADVSTGIFSIINNNATVSHNVKIGNFVHIAIQAAVAGGVTIGEGTLIGTGSVILPEIKIGKWAIVGAGAIVTKDVPDYAVVYGNPASITKYTKQKHE